MEPAFNLEFCDHTAFRIVRYGAILKESLRQVRFVVSFKDVFVGDKSENGNSFVEHDVHLLIAFLLRWVELEHVLKILYRCLPLSSPSSGSRQ